MSPEVRWIRENVLYEVETDTKWNFNTDRLMATTAGCLAGWLMRFDDQWYICCAGNYKNEVPKHIQDAYELGLLMGDVDV